MKAAWIRPGDDRIPDGAKAKRYGIDTLIWDATDSQIDAAFFKDVRSWGFRPGITRDPTWTNATAVDLARELDADLARLGSSSLTCLVVADIEAMWQRGSQYVIDFLTEWRALRPSRATVWTTEPLQGGTVNDLLAKMINADTNLLVAPQLYDEHMTPYPENDVALELGQNPNRRNIARQRIVSYYDASRLPAAWNGIAFDFARLP